MDDVLKVLIQAFMANPIMNEEDAQTLFQKICQKIPAPGARLPGSLAEAARAVNGSRLERAGLELRSLFADNGRCYWGLANTRADEQARDALLQAVGAPDCHAYKALLELLVKRAPRASLGYAEASGKVAATAKLQAAAADALLQRLVAGLWLARDQDQQLVAGPRAQLELRQLLSDLGAADCTLCHEPVLRGVPCPNPPCAVQLHAHCALKWFGDRPAAQHQCPTCTRPWSSPVQPL